MCKNACTLFTTPGREPPIDVPRTGDRHRARRLEGHPAQKHDNRWRQAAVGLHRGGVLAARRLSRVVLSTDDDEIARVGRECGLEVPFMRPAELARDDTPSLPVVQDVVRRLEVSGDRFDAIFTLQPTNPLRRPSDIDGAIDLLERSGADSVISFVDVGERHPGA